MRRWDTFAACAVLFGALLACGASVSGWRPHTSSHHERIADRAIEIQDGDLKEIRAAGGAFLGVLWMDEGATGGVGDVVSREAAKKGGTHFLFVTASSETTRFGVYDVKDSKYRYNVYRVPTGAWDELGSLAPKKP